MALDLKLIGKKLSGYRQQMCISIDDISAATGIPSEMIRAYELGEKEPSGDEILIFADFFHCDFRFFISNDRLAPFEQTESLYRKHGAEFSSDDRLRIQEFLFLCESEHFLNAELGHSPQAEQFVFRKSGAYYKGHGEKAAAELRRFLGYDSNAIGMDIYQDIRRLGVHVFRRKLGNSNISGLFVKHPTAGRCVLINYDEDVYRQRFTAAHEAAHSILDDEDDFVVSFRNWERRDLIEIRANTFASRILMPQDFLRQIPNATSWDGTKLVEWAKHLKVSTTALGYALVEAGLLDEDQRQSLGSVQVPPNQKVDPELPSTLTTQQYSRKRELLEHGLSDHFVNLCFEAYEENVVTRGRLVELLLIDESFLPELAALYGRSLRYG